MFEFLCWLAGFSTLSIFIYLALVGIGLTTKRQIPQQDEYDLTGVIDVKADNESQSNNTDVGLRSQFDRDSG